MTANKKLVTKGKVMIELEIDNKVSPWVESVITELSNSKPKFSSKADAIFALNSELESLAASRSLSVPDLLDLAASSVENHDDLDRSLRISSLIYSLKNL